MRGWGVVRLRAQPGPGGRQDPQAKPLRSQGGVAVLEVVRSTHRSVYTVRLGTTVYVLHCFQKKATQGIATPRPELELIAARLKAAEAHAKGEGS